MLLSVDSALNDQFNFAQNNSRSCVKINMKLAVCTTIQALEEQSKTESIVLIKSEPRYSSYQ